MVSKNTLPPLLHEYEPKMNTLVESLTKTSIFLRICFISPDGFKGNLSPLEIVCFSGDSKWKNRLRPGRETRGCGLLLSRGLVVPASSRLQGDLPLQDGISFWLSSWLD